jgi:hypothetical protein
MHEYICFDPAWEAYNAPRRYASEDEYFEARYDALDLAEEEAREYAESMAELIEFDSDEERDAYIEEEFEEEYARLREERGI